MRRHSVEPSVFVIAVGGNDRPNVMACGWNNKLSYNPPLLGISLQVSGFTHHLIEERREFVVAVPTPALEEELLYVGSVSGSEVDKFTATGLKTQPASKISVPLLADARANYECALQQTIEVGDHIFFIGQIVAAHYDPSKEQLFFAGRNPDNTKRFESIRTTFPGE